MAKKAWIVTDSNHGHEWDNKRSFLSREDAEEFATKKARDNEEDYYIFEAVAVVSTPKVPVQVTEITA